uniref:MRH domain-containing protein n=1 Tax=Strigamia maritima TaxID=126957 RepID=T1JC96_STRMM
MQVSGHNSVHVAELPCYVYFHWQTSAVCSHSCVVFGNDGKVVDLGPLGSISHVWNVTDTSGNTYWINVCHGLQSKSLMNSDCPPDATICMKSKSGVKMLGVLDTQKLAFNDKQNAVEVTYSSPTASDVCKSNRVAKVSINFTCATGVGSPEFIRKDEASCEFFFDWPSWTACPEVRSEERIKWVSGFVEDKKLALRIDFSKLLQR